MRNTVLDEQCFEVERAADTAPVLGKVPSVLCEQPFAGMPAQQLRAARPCAEHLTCRAPTAGGLSAGITHR